jgi:predicted RecB family nuclease
MDLFGDVALRDPVNPFVQLLWDRGNEYEQDVIGKLDIPFTSLKHLPLEEKESQTYEAMNRGDDFIYGGRISADDLVGEPDILRRCGTKYAAGDIKSGAGEEGGSEDTDGKPKKHYAVQLALYTDILERRGYSGGHRPFVWDIHGQEVFYDLDAPQGVKKTETLWDEYQEVLEIARRIMTGSESTLPAYGSTCKLCHWYNACKKSAEEDDDLTLIPELGRTKRDDMLPIVKTRRELARADISAFISGKKTKFRGIGIDTLIKLQNRAILQKTPGASPYLKEAIAFPSHDRELFFDVETDPMRDICYLHGFVERYNGETRKETYRAFFAEEPTDTFEMKAFEDAWAYIRGMLPCSIYYYSAYEKTVWTKLQKKYPSVMSPEEVDALFASPNAVDLYFQVVKPKTEWPTYDHSIKTLASHLGFSWRDPNPSGAASIEWYHRWTESRDPSIRQRIFDYNEDDCRAMRVLLDGIWRLSIK